VKTAGVLAWLLMTAGITESFSQPFTSIKGFFTVDQVDGCAPLGVNISVKPDLSATTCNPFSLDFTGDGTVDATSTGTTCNYNIQYGSPGLYKLVVYLGGLGSGNVDEIIIQVRPDIKPAFEIYSCQGSKVQVKVTDKSYDQYFINFNADQDAIDDVTLANSAIMTSTFSYPSAGSKKISVRGKYLNAIDKCSAEIKDFSAVLTPTAATINQLEVTGPAGLKFDYTPAGNTQYRLDIAVDKTGPFQQIKTLYQAQAVPSSEVLTGLNTEKSFYCLQLRTFDPCANQSFDQKTICSINTSLSVGNKEMTLSWVTGNLSSAPFRIERDGTFRSSATGSPFSDTGLTCNTSYSYTVSQQYGSSGPVSRSKSQVASARSDDIPTAVNNISSEVTAAGPLKMVWEQDPAFSANEYKVERVPGFNAPVTVATNTYSDADYIAAAAPFYSVRYKDICGINSPAGRKFQALRLSGQVLKDNRDSLRWNSYKGYEDGVQAYRISVTDKSGSKISPDIITSGAADTTFSSSETDGRYQQVVYRVSAVPVKTGLPESLSETVELTRKARIVAPNAFTPDGDGNNETMKLYGQFVQSIDFRIFDRWGKLVSETSISAVSATAKLTPIDVWNGKNFDGNEMPESTYVWTAVFTDQLGNSFSQSGTVALYLFKKP